jgi:hypothetical protein
MLRWWMLINLVWAGFNFVTYGLYYSPVNLVVGVFNICAAAYCYYVWKEIS